MKILLDECLPKKLSTLITNFEVQTVRQLSWHTFKNGTLLDKAQHQFDFLITVDKNMPTQLNLLKYNIGVIILAAKSNSIIDIQPLVPKIIEIVNLGKFTGEKVIRA
jgi:predicted nuclease of predicted toxin-antitoxin system